MSTTFVRAAARLLVVPVATSVFLAAPAPASHAVDRAVATTTLTAGSPTAARVQRKVTRVALGERAVAKARSRAGSPYRYGANGPRAFDCSGLTQWVYKKLGKRLPRTSGAQAGAVRRVGKPRRGDLVFFHSGGRVYHVGIYAGKRKVWHASRPGHPVAKERIWTRSVFYGRVR
ncbi:C40 family peptidase [Nocardioides sp. J54]|uniref:C40 family peptidase n=1 Tax=Nocardioides sp. J54 TaxID=935866 RepID=UPI0004B0902C|nr:C40 family peptidase [Nocardioides sp. J54]